MRTDRQADVTKLIVAFRNFAKVPKIVLSLETTCVLPSSVDGHVTGVVYAFLAFNISQFQKGFHSWPVA
jgi:hypothetical protein